MSDEEFLAGKLDTAFISRFNERRKETIPDQTASDIAVIAAAVGYASDLRSIAAETSPAATEPSRWVKAGRAALHGR